MIETIVLGAVYILYFAAVVPAWSVYWEARIYRVLAARNMEMSGRTIAKTLGGGVAYGAVYSALESLQEDRLVASRVFEMSPDGILRRVYWAVGNQS